MSVVKQMLQIQSECLNREVFIGIVASTKIEKIMLLLHGFNGTFKHLDDNLPLERYANDYHMILITPNMNNGYYMDKENYCVTGFLFQELLPLILQKFELGSDLPMYIAGISMGGFGSLLIGSAFPDKFQKIISVGGAFIAHDVAIGNPQIVGMRDNMEALNYFLDTFSPFNTLESDICRNPVVAVTNCKENIIPKLILTCGTKDELYTRNLEALKQFDACGTGYDWFPIEDGLHDYKAFDAGLKYAFQRIAAE